MDRTLARKLLSLDWNSFNFSEKAFSPFSFFRCTCVLTHSFLYQNFKNFFSCNFYFVQNLLLAQADCPFLGFFPWIIKMVFKLFITVFVLAFHVGRLKIKESVIYVFFLSIIFHQKLAKVFFFLVYKSRKYFSDI